jgi:opacity protein-like surface antigen
MLPLPLLLGLVFPNFISLSHAADGGQVLPQGIGKNMVGFKLGGYSPQSDELYNFDLGAIGEVSFQHNFTQFFGIGAGFGFFQTNNKTNAEVVSQVDPATSIVTNTSLDQTLKTTYVMLNATLMIPVGEFVPYVEGGGDLYFISTDESFSSRSVVIPTGEVVSSTSGSITTNDQAVGYHVGAGVNWFFTNDYYIGLGGRYIWAKSSDLKIKIDGVMATVNLGVRF